ncbi:MAG: T9SS type A sorting domain-containing protein [Bacteroidota bacterium]
MKSPLPLLKKKYLLFSLFIAVFSGLAAQDKVFGIEMKLEGVDLFLQDIEVDAAGALYTLLQKSVNNQRSGIITKTDAEGNMIWSKEVTNSEQFMNAEAIIVLDEHTLAAGFVDYVNTPPFFSSNITYCIMNTDDGTLSKAYRIGNTDANLLQDILLDDDGNPIMMIHHGTAGFYGTMLLELDKDDATTTDTSYIKSGIYTYLNQLVKTEGGYLGVGNDEESNNPNDRALLYRWDHDLNPIDGILLEQNESAKRATHVIKTPMGYQLHVDSPFGSEVVSLNSDLEIAGAVKSAFAPVTYSAQVENTHFTFNQSNILEGRSEGNVLSSRLVGTDLGYSDMIRIQAETRSLWGVSHHLDNTTNQYNIGIKKDVTDNVLLCGSFNFFMEDGDAFDITAQKVDMVLPCPDYERVDISSEVSIDDIALETTLLCESTVVTSVNTSSVESSMKIYPNPASNIIHIENMEGNYQIINGMGQVVDAGFINGESIDVSRLPAGMYYIKMEKECQSFVIMMH